MISIWHRWMLHTTTLHPHGGAVTMQKHSPDISLQHLGAISRVPLWKRLIGPSAVKADGPNVCHVILCCYYYGFYTEVTLTAHLYFLPSVSYL